MYRTLFSLAGLAIVAWLPLIFVPHLHGTRRLAESAIFPLFLATLYVIGIAGVLSELGPGIMRDFGNVDGVLALLATESLALVAWIHILAFDQVVGLLIYRDNMRHRFVPLPVQSMILFLTLMFGPVGFLVYTVTRLATRRSGRVAWGSAAESELLAAVRPSEAVPVTTNRFADVRHGNSVPAMLLSLLRRERVLTGCALLAFALAGVCAAAAAVRGSWSVPPEGRLLDAFKFEAGVGIYFLTLTLLLPLSGMGSLARMRWVRWSAVIAVYFVSIEAVQALRGLDPRFTTAGNTLDQAAGAVFGVTALLLIVLFAVLARRFFRSDVLVDHQPLRAAVRYGIAATFFAFGSGLLMTVLRTRIVAETGNLMPLHAAGFHGIQAIPLVALLVGASALDGATQMRVTHAAGVAWLLLCASLLLQAVLGEQLFSVTPAGAGTTIAFLAWAACFGVAARAFRRSRQPFISPVGGSSGRWSI